MSAEGEYFKPELEKFPNTEEGLQNLLEKVTEYIESFGPIYSEMEKVSSEDKSYLDALEKNEEIKEDEIAFFQSIFEKLLENEKNQRNYLQAIEMRTQIIKSLEELRKKNLDKSPVEGDSILLEDFERGNYPIESLIGNQELIDTLKHLSPKEKNDVQNMISELNLRESFVREHEQTISKKREEFESLMAKSPEHSRGEISGISEDLERIKYLQGIIYEYDMSLMRINDIYEDLRKFSK